MKKTVHTIAEQLGLAPSTISKILNNTGNFSQATRDKVLKYTQEIGYVPAVSARVLKSNKSWSIGVVYTEESSVGLEHPFFVSVLQHFKAYIEKSGYELSFIVKRLGQHEMSYLGWCKNKKIDGVFLVVGSHNNPGIVELIESDIPCVSTDIFHEQLPIVLSDNERGVELSLNYALSQGANQLGYITGPTTSRSFRNRLLKFKSLLEEKQFPEEQVNIIAAKGFGYDSGKVAGMALLDQCPNPPDFVIVGSDILAFGAIRAFQEAGFRIPKDIRVSGFDDVSFASMFNPALTTIQQNTAEIGETAAKVLIDLINNPRPKQQDIYKVPVKLIVRESA